MATAPRPGLEAPLAIANTEPLDDELRDHVRLVVAMARELPRPFQQVIAVDDNEARFAVTLERFCGIDAGGMCHDLALANRVLPLDVWWSLADFWLGAVEAIPRQSSAWASCWMPHQLGFDLRGTLTLSVDEHNHCSDHWPGPPHFPTRITRPKSFNLLSPEHLRGAPLLDASRVHEMANLLICLLTLERPFSSESELASLQRILDGRAIWHPEVHPDCPPAVAVVLNRALEVDPAERYPSIGEFRAALRSVVGCPPASMERVMAVAFGVKPERLRECVAQLQAQAQWLPASWVNGGLAVLEDQLLERLAPVTELPVRNPVPAPPVAAKVDVAPTAQAPWWRRVWPFR